VEVDRVAIVGTGLIGASMGLGLTERGCHVVGWDPDPEALGVATTRGALSESRHDLAALLATPADVLVVAAPPAATVELVRRIGDDRLVMDVAGVKCDVVAAGGLRFVGTHPMAGREVSGPHAASGALFRGATWVIVTDGATPEDLATVEGLVRRLEARPVRMTARAHDAAVARISHLPQVLAAALLATAAREEGALELAAGGFRDLTRVAASDPGVWVELLVANAGPVGEALRALGEQLEAVAAALDERDAVRLASFLAVARDRRRRLAPPVVAVRVAIADRPGELAKVGRALAESGVDVRDLQLRHAPYGGGGVLTLSVRPGEAETLRAALEAQGMIVGREDPPAGRGSARDPR